ncbi:MotA/TolQ/ExbB proton channel family protein [Pseudogracilibacillus auburnensis]|uniref:MotA/TolQ/ExbB proton channel family protein n=1 Tax=Pseudogracilibacillus auburnensis TaxID=1494959 RepID=A0A2V3W8G0_9BACI|nr:MotA/TolQ/ExbB proton channel family protein [Pseudogracilibacillus auburnensis]PXW89454.1 MotA/TolQ/ExbB proton channel family protein [Pseudogracilibacillus auburnensis]
MLQALLELITTEQKAEAMLENPIIEVIFMALFILFLVTLFTHLALFFKIRRTRNYIKETNRFDIEPLQTFKREFDDRQTDEAMKVETFVQEKISSWRIFQLPVISAIKLVQMTISVFILLGVLGTFIGLTISLGSINASSEQLVENVAGVLSGIDVAFYTSIIGMGFSLIMTVLVRIFNTEYMLTDLMLRLESHLEGEEQHGMNRMIGVSEKIHEGIIHLQQTNEGIVDAFHGFKDYTSGLQQSAKDLAAFNDGLSENLETFQELFQQMKVITDGFSEGTTQLNKNFASLFTYFKQAERKNERIAHVFEHTYEKIQDVSQAQINSLEQFDTSVSDLKSFTSSLLDEQKDVHDALDGISNKTEDLVNIMGQHERQLRDIFGDDLQIKLSNMTNHLGELTTSLNKIGSSITTLPEALDIINKTQTEYKSLLGDRFRELKQFNESFNEHLKSHATDSANFEKNMHDATTSFEQMATKNNELMNEINRTVTQVNQTFIQRDQQLETNVAMLKETLSNYVSSLEGTLGQKLDTVIRNIENSMYVTSDGLKREITEMRRLSEETNQNHARQVQQLLQELNRETQTLNRHVESIGQQAASKRTGLDQNEY